MKILKSSENYLETILILKNRKGFVRAVDIANELGFSKPSVSVALKQLREHEYISVDEGGMLSLMPKGLAIAEDMLERHTYLKKALIKLGVSEGVADEDACKIEHIISVETLDAIKNFVNG